MWAHLAALHNEWPLVPCLIRGVGQAQQACPCPCSPCCWLELARHSPPKIKALTGSASAAGRRCNQQEPIWSAYRSHEMPKHLSDLEAVAALMAAFSSSMPGGLLQTSCRTEGGI